MGRLAGKVALVTGAARGQGRSHAVRLAEEGADIIAVDVCAPIDTVTYEAATPADLETTVKEIEARDRRVVARVADVRSYDALSAAVDEGVAELGRLDVVVANAGILSHSLSHEMSSEMWQTSLDVNLTGVWHTTRAASRHLIEQGTGGAIVLTSSIAGLMGLGNLSHYTAAKHGVTGLARALAIELGPHRIRVNTVHPGNTLTRMLDNETLYHLFRPDLENPTLADTADGMRSFNLLPEPWLDPVEISNAIVFLVSDEARFITGVALPVDAGMAQKPPGS